MSQNTKIVNVDKDYCTSCGQCTEEVPKYFQLDDDYLAESHIEGEYVNKAPIPEDDWNMVQGAIDDCPGEGIAWRN